ncbi:non-heme iron oxygenase ferredoxin subunit [Paracidovorax konjaci]|uniref:Naphthalene 1,2-dioxygenase system ferredoxin subunit n=1 Tax=Paracidovorax konjaci TaxID=32040 RepID=A0A1I1UWJ4_9BURK|nr:non-heme iron oxygenase ferredoxin subunit [Paracidovorax konjaci]SFD72400.1 naphthalene 1,2-dioxygenase system ferredoxin subunit [Paracidovorax konjaci]
MTAIDTGWTEAAALDDVPQDDVVGVSVGGRDVALYAVEGEVFATDNLCTHGNARLCDGFLEGHEIECPLHQGRFDVRDGRALCAPLTQGLRTYPVRIEQGKVYLQLEGA